MAGLVSNKVGNWLQNNADKTDTTSGGYQRNYTTMFQYETFRVRLLPIEDPDYSTHVLVYLPYTADASVFGLNNNAILFDDEKECFNVGNYDAELTESQEYAGWYKAKLSVGEALYVVATAKGRSGGLYQQYPDKWTLIHCSGNVTVTGKTQEYTPTHFLYIASRHQNNDGSFDYISQLHSGIVMLYAPILPMYINPNCVMAPDISAVSNIPRETDEWSIYGYHEQLNAATPVLINVLTRVTYDISASHKIQGYLRTLQFSYDGRLLGISPEQTYVIDTASVYPSAQTS